MILSKKKMHVQTGISQLSKVIFSKRDVPAYALIDAHKILFTESISKVLHITKNEGKLLQSSGRWRVSHRLPRTCDACPSGWRHR
jgi:hypothetical protein